METVKRAADWLRAHKWQITAAALALLLLCGVWARHYGVSCEVGSLREAYADSLAQVRQLQAQTERLERELAAKAAQIAELQTAHDRQIREVTASAYRKARSLRDADVVGAYNALIAGARRRNAERGRDNGER